jgi:DNA-binding NarL/FixJ family response regulator
LTRITLVEDHELFAEALDVALTLEGHEVHRVSMNQRALQNGQLLAAILHSHPRVVLLDLNLGAIGNGARVIAPLTRAGIAVVVVTASNDEARWGECLFYGARTVLSKSTPLSTIMSTIRMIGEQRRILPREERERLVAGFREAKGRALNGHARLASLTAREGEILYHLMNGKQVRDIAREAVVSEATVRTQVKSIFAKLEVSSQLAAVTLALRANWRPPIQREQS